MATRKKTITKKVVPAKKEEVTINSALKIIKEYKMGIVELSETQAICISLIINAELNSFVYVHRICRTKITDEWKKEKSGAIWLPFREMHNICDVLIHAYDEGLKMGLDNVYRPTGTIYHPKNENIPINNNSTNKSFNNSMFNPELWTAVLEVGLIYIKRSKTISEWKNQMMYSCSSEIEFLLPAILKVIQSYPPKVQFDEDVMNIIFKYVADNFEDKITDFYEIYDEISNLDSLKNKKNIRELTQAAYIGMEFFLKENQNSDFSVETNVNELKLGLKNAIEQTKLF